MGESAESELEYRRAASDLLRIREWLECHPAHNGGIWLDRGQGEGPVRVGVALARYRAGLESELRALAQYPESVDVVSVRWPLRDLRALQDRISAHRTRASKHMRGSTMPTIGVEQRTNRVKIGLHPYDEHVAAWLLRRFGRYRVTVVSGEPVHIRAGIATGPGAAD